MPGEEIRTDGAPIVKRWIGRLNSKTIPVKLEKLDPYCRKVLAPILMFNAPDRLTALNFYLLYHQCMFNLTLDDQDYRLEPEIFHEFA